MREAIRRPTGDGVLDRPAEVFLSLPESFQSQPSKAKVLGVCLRLSLSQTLSRRLRIPPGRPQVYEDFGFWRLLGRKNAVPRCLQKLIKV